MRVLSGSYLVWFRSDLPREEVKAYWRGPHGQVANQIPAMQEYLQHHFSNHDHGFWPASPGLATNIPDDWRIDGLTEVRFRSFWSALVSAVLHTRGIARDEQNIFDRVLGILARPGGGRWWTGPYQSDVGFRAVLFVRARHETRGKPFREFIEDELAPAILAAGAKELRTHLLAPGSSHLHRTPNVRHDQPCNRAYSCAVIIGTRNRADFDRLINSAALVTTQPAQRRHCVAMHAYAVENTYPLVLDSRAQPATWN